MADPGGFARYLWEEKMPLPDAWAQHSPSFHDRILAYWIEKSESDEWTFDQLRNLLGNMMDTDEPVLPPLQRWAYEVAAGRRKCPTRRGPKGDRTRDAHIAARVYILRKGMSQRAAERLLADELNMSPEAVASARRRGNAALFRSK